MVTDKFMYKIGKKCKSFRVDYLGYTQKEMCKIVGCKETTLSAFECGRDNNVKFIYCYYMLAKNKHFEKIFFQKLFTTLDFSVIDIYVNRSGNNVEKDSNR